MARPIWNGTISFGLLQVPVQLMPGERSVDLHFRMLDGRTKTPIRYERINAETGEEVPWKDIVKAFEYVKGSYAVIDEKVLKEAAPESTETVDIEAFVDADAVDLRYYERPYFLVPGKRAEKGYVLLRETLKKTKKVGIAKLVIRTRQYLAMLKPQEDALVLILLRFPQEVIEADEYTLPSGNASVHKVNAREVDMAAKLVESMSVDWKPADYKDDFRDKLKKLVEMQVKKQTGGKRTLKAAKEAPEPENAGNVVDFMSLLQKSLDTGKRTAPDKAAPAKKATGKAAAKSKAPAKKTATRRRAAK